MGIEFFNTMMGRKYYEADVPRITKALERIADALEKQNESKIVEVKETELLHYGLPRDAKGRDPRDIEYDKEFWEANNKDNDNE